MKKIPGFYRWVIVFALTVPVTPVKASGNAPVDNYNARLEEGIDLFYQTEWLRAADIFRNLQQAEPGDPRAWFFESMIPCWKYFFADGSGKSAKQFMRLSEKAISVGRDHLESQPGDTTVVLLMSGLYGYRSLIAASEKQYEVAMKSGLDGYRYTRQLLQLGDRKPQALIGKGMIYYMLGSIPPGLKWLTGFTGIKADKALGLQFLEQAARSNSHVSLDARLILMYLYEKEGDFSEALYHISRLCEVYPENTIFNYHEARILELSKRNSEAKMAYEQVILLKNEQLDTLVRKSRARLVRLNEHSD